MVRLAPTGPENTQALTIIAVCKIRNNYRKNPKSCCRGSDARGSVATLMGWCSFATSGKCSAISRAFMSFTGLKCDKRSVMQITQHCDTRIALIPVRRGFHRDTTARRRADARNNAEHASIAQAGSGIVNATAAAPLLAPDDCLRKLVNRILKSSSLTSPSRVTSPS